MEQIQYDDGEGTRRLTQTAVQVASFSRLKTLLVEALGSSIDLESIVRLCSMAQIKRQ